MRVNSVKFPNLSSGMIKFVTSPLSQNDRREITNEKLLLLGR